MKRYQLVDEATELHGFIGKAFYESNEDQQALEKLMEMRDNLKRERNITLVMVDTWNHRQIIAS
jgi:hypothetical protein